MFTKYTYSGDLNTGQVWYPNGQKLSDHRMVRNSNTIRIPDTHALDRSTILAPLRYSDVLYSDPHCIDINFFSDYALLLI